MPQSISQKRPWLAALLAAFLTGLGHLYLRRWRRALGWLAGSFLVSILFVDPAAADELVAGNVTTETLLGAAPMFFVVGLSTVDAYLLAHTQNRTQNPVQNAGTRPSETTDEDEETIPCPHCGKPLDPDLEFCHWCTRSVEDVDHEQLEESTDTE